MSESWATSQGTKEYFDKIAIQPEKVRRFGDLYVSALGAGTYLGETNDETDKLYEEILIKAALSGVNFFDTSISCRSMRSEKVLKKAIQGIKAQGILREQIVISTKGGYFPVEEGCEIEDSIRMHYLDNGVVQPSEIVGGIHCMSPRFLENQIEKSLKNIGIDCIDLYFLQNPEMELSDLGEEEFYKRLLYSFLLFEKKVEEKKIRSYGVATWNGFRVKKGNLQLDKVIQCALEAGGEGHHFKAIQLPYNLVMLEAIKMKNQIEGKEKKSIWKSAEEKGISILVSSPFMEGKISHLCPRLFEKLVPEETPMLQALQYVLSTPKICTAFVGMREMKHLEENLKVLTKSDWPLKSWEAVSALIGL